MTITITTTTTLPLQTGPSKDIKKEGKGDLLALWISGFGSNLHNTESKSQADLFYSQEGLSWLLCSSQQCCADPEKAHPILYLSE